MSEHIKDMESDFYESIFDIAIFYHRGGEPIPNICRSLVKAGMGLFLTHLRDNTKLSDEQQKDAIALLITAELNELSDADFSELEFEIDEGEP